MFVRYDPVMRSLTGTESSSDPDGLRAALSASGVTFVEYMGALPGMFEDCCVNEDGSLGLLELFPESCRHPDQFLDQHTAVPEMSDLPEGSEVTPPPGTMLPSGTTVVSLRAPWYKAHHYNITIRTTDDIKADLVYQARNRRWELEQLGAPFKNLRLATDDRCKTLIASSMAVADIIERRTGEKWSTVWSFIDGKLSVSRADLDDMALTIGAYIALIFGVCDSIESKIDSGSITSADQISPAFDTGMRPATSA